MATRKTPPKISVPEEYHYEKVPKSYDYTTIAKGRTEPITPEELDKALTAAIKRVENEMSDTIWAAATKLVLNVGRRYLKEELIKK
mgnify:FL=1